MTTKLTKPVSRVTGVMVRDGSAARLLVATLHAEFITLRLKGTQREEVVSLEAAYFHAIKARVFKAKMEKAKLRKYKKGLK